MTRVFNAHRSFPELAHDALADSQLRDNLANATSTIRAKRASAVEELDDWETLRTAGAAIKDYVLDHLDELVVELERNVVLRGGVVHWARDANEANEIVVNLVKEASANSVVKVKSMVTGEIGLNLALEQHGIAAYETDLAELIVQLGDDLPSHILVPAIHKNRSQIRDIFKSEMGKSGLAAPDGLSDEPTELAAAARAHLRDRFLSAKVGISGANFLVASTGGLVIVESEGNGRMCLTLPNTLISVVGIEKILPDWESLGVFLQLLPRSSTGERMNPYTSIFTGVAPGDGPSQFHLVLLDNGRTSVLRDPVGREVLRCIRCSACLNVCPVYERTGGHAYGNIYPGPIGAVLTPQLRRNQRTDLEKSLPFASTLCGACLEVCPVKIDIPKILVHLRSEIVDDERSARPLGAELLAMKGVARVFSTERVFSALVSMSATTTRLLRLRKIQWLPSPFSAWTRSRDMPVPAYPSFRKWFFRGHAKVSSFVARSRGANLTHRPRSHNDPTTPKSANAGERRSEMLSSIRYAAKSTDSDVLPRATMVRKKATLNADERLIQFRERLADYKATVSDATTKDIGTRIDYLLRRHQSDKVVMAADCPSQWSKDVHSEITYDEGLSAGALDAFDATITGCALAIAETGTIVLDAGHRQGRRALSLIPDHLIVIVDEYQIVDDVPEAVASLDPTSLQTWISGPSATSDIELQRIEGVHGPRILDVIILHK